MTCDVLALSAAGAPSGGQAPTNRALVYGSMRSSALCSAIEPGGRTGSQPDTAEESIATALSDNIGCSGVFRLLGLGSVVISPLALWVTSLVRHVWDHADAEAVIGAE